MFAVDWFVPFDLLVFAVDCVMSCLTQLVYAVDCVVSCSTYSCMLVIVLCPV